MFPNYFKDINIYTILLRVFLALFVGGVIGLERGRKRHPAGFKTYMLVCLGATLVMMTNQYMYVTFSMAGDISRLGAQVISGIGFLGAGTIIVTKRNQVRGLTTAAGLWTAACVGLAIGIGFYEGALVAGGAVLLIMTFFNKLDVLLYSRSTILKLYMNLSTAECVTKLVEYFKEKGYQISDMQLYKEKEVGIRLISVVLTLKLPKGMDHEKILEEVAEFDGITYMEEL